MKCNDGSQWHLVLALQICNLSLQWGSHLTLGCRGEDDCILLAAAVAAAMVLAADFGLAGGPATEALGACTLWAA